MAVYMIVALSTGQILEMCTSSVLVALVAVQVTIDWPRRCFLFVHHRYVCVFLWDADGREFRRIAERGPTPELVETLPVIVVVAFFFPVQSSPIKSTSATDSGRR